MTQARSSRRLPGTFAPKAHADPYLAGEFKDRVVARRVAVPARLALAGAILAGGIAYGPALVHAAWHLAFGSGTQATSQVDPTNDGWPRVANPLAVASEVQRTCAGHTVTYSVLGGMDLPAGTVARTHLPRAAHCPPPWVPADLTIEGTQAQGPLTVTSLRDSQTHVDMAVVTGPAGPAEVLQFQISPPHRRHLS